MSILFVFLLAAVPACGEETEPAPSASPVAQIGETLYFTLNDAASKASESDEIKILAPGSYTVPADKDLTITAEVEGVVFANLGEYNMKGANVTFNNVTFNWTNDNYKGLQHSGDLVYNNCTINGQPFLYGTSETFTGCTFNQSSENAYNVWTYGAPNVTFNDCVFNCAGKAVLIYSESKTLFSEVTFKDCRLIASAPVTDKAAIEMNSNYTAGIKLTINGTTATGFDNGNVSGNPLWNNKMGNAGENNDITVIVDGETVLDVFYAAKIGDDKYKTLQAAINDAENETVITLLGNVTEDVTVTQQAGVNFTIDGADNTLSGVIVVDGKSARYEGAGLTVRNVNFDAETVSGDAYINLGNGNSNTRYTNNVAAENCTFSFSGSGDVVAVKSYTGGDWNLNVTGCTVNEGMHSLLQVKNVEKGLEIRDCAVYSKEGLNLNSCVGANITNCTFNVLGYAVRVGVNNTSKPTPPQTFTLKNNSLMSACNDGDAVLIIRDSAANAVITLEKNAFFGTTHIAGVTKETDISADKNYWGGKSAPVVSGEPVEITYYYADKACTQLKLYSEIDSIFDGAADIEINADLPDGGEPIYVPSAETLANDSSERPYAEGYVFTGWKDNQNGTVTAEWEPLPTDFTFYDLVKAYNDLGKPVSEAVTGDKYDLVADGTITVSDILLLSQYIADATSQQAKSD